MVAISLFSCSKHEDESTTVNHVNDSINTLTLQQARLDAIAAAGAIAVSDTTDTLAMQRAIINAYATRSKMVLDGNENAAETFDKELKQELRRLNPKLADEIFSNP